VLFLAGRDITEWGYIGRINFFVREIAKKEMTIIVNHPQYWKRNWNRAPSAEYRNYLPEGRVTIVNGYPIPVPHHILCEFVNFVPRLLILLRLCLQYEIIYVVNYLQMPSSITRGLWNIKGKAIILDYADYPPSLLSYIPFKALTKPLVRAISDLEVMASDGVVTCSNLLSKEVRRVRSDETKLVSNGCYLNANTGTKRKEYRRRLGFGDEIVFGYVGSIRRSVKIDDVLRCLPKIKEASLLVVGDGPQLPAFKAIANELGLEARTRFVGRASRETVNDYISAMDICLVPFEEGIFSYFDRPLKFFEYACMGKPILVSRIPELMLTFPEKDHPYIAYYSGLEEFQEKAIMFIQAIEQGEFEAGLNEFKERIKREYNWEILSNRFREYCERVAKMD
jgi:glycosyltransferase involved in cell wall biosynthesis